MLCYTMADPIIPDYVLDDLSNFISKNYPNGLPNSLLIAQAFILKYTDYGNEFGLHVINKVIEDGIKQGFFVSVRKVL
jgi:hypothetical protein